jgi:hypothetical protein
MLVILASRFDAESASLAAEWASYDGRLMTPADLSKSGWRDLVGETPSRASAVISGKKVDLGDIDGVLVRLPGILEAELGNVVAADRKYVASEMTAYLISWLTRLECPVYNRPSANSLLGPGWRAEQWVHAAANLGLRVETMRVGCGDGRRRVRPRRRSMNAVTAVGDHVFGAPDERTARQVRALSASAGAATLTAWFSSDVKGVATLQEVSTWPRLDSKEVREATLRLFLRAKARPVARTPGGST